MPGGDRTGPRGQGPRTGRKAGFCSGYKMPGYANKTTGPYRGLPRFQGRAGRGRKGRGRRAGRGAPWR